MDRESRPVAALTGPFFLLMAVTSLLHGLRVAPLGAYGWAWLGGVTLLGALVMTYVPERIWGRYAGSG